MTTEAIAGVTYPSAASLLPNNNFALLGYNSEDKETIVTVSDLTGSLTKPLKGFKTGEGGGEIIIDQVMIEHFLHNGKHFPFSVGMTSNSLYYFNGFVDYNFSLAFTDLNADTPNGIVFGEKDDGGFSAISYISGNNFAISRFHFGDNYFLPFTTLPENTQTSVELTTFHPLPELTPNAPVKILRTTINEKKIVLYGSDTKSKQIGLYFYSEDATGEFISSKYLGFSNPYEFASFTRTADGGLAVCGTTHLAGRFPRICIFKIPADELNENVPK